jgi:Ca2+-binding RTX toxin-like protein
MAIIYGTIGDDKYPNGVELRGTNLADEIYGLAGNDTLVGFGGGDLLEGGAGGDELFGSDGFDHASYRGSSEGINVNLRTGAASGGHAAGEDEVPNPSIGTATVRRLGPCRNAGTLRPTAASGQRRCLAGG